MRSRWVAAVLVLAGAVTAACSSESSPSPSPAPSSSSPTAPPPHITLTFGVYGTPQEVASYTKMAQGFRSSTADVTVQMRPWETRDDMIRSIRRGEKLPDVFLASRHDLKFLEDRNAVQPVDDLLEQRGIDFGDTYARDSLLAFGTDNRLQCLPYGISPQVIYYNPDLVRFDRMSQRGLDVPSTPGRWTFEQFAAAAKFASRPRRGIAGVSIQPTLEGLAPFVLSGGGSVFDSADTPTSLSLSSSDSVAALELTLELLRNPHVTLTARQQAQATPLQWFERGKLAMIAGDRSLVPELRTTPGLRFNVMPMPVLGSSATVGEFTGLCLSPDASSIADAADFLVYATSDEAVSEVAQDGYLEPANQQVALSEAFLQPDQMPANASIFNDSVRAMQVSPLLDTWSQLEAAVDPRLADLLTEPVIGDLAQQLAQIDAASVPVLAPPTPSGSPSDPGSTGSSPSP